MSTQRENVSLWFQSSEPDYYLFFLKSWIPFNSWYVQQYPHLKKKDTEIIKAIQDGEDSKPRKIIENFLTNTNDYSAKEFKRHLAELHFNLEKNVLTHNDIRLTFKNLSLTGNPVKFRHFMDLENRVYKVEKTERYFQAYIEGKGGKVFLDFKKPVYDLEGLQKDIDFLRLEGKVKSKIISLFKDIDPKKPISLISISKKKGEFIYLESKNSIKFIYDEETVAKACIKVLYSLRCMLFHGEVTPNNANKKTYKYAFYILQLINKQIF